MKKVILSLSTFLLIALIVPQIALAVWWNPFTWFNNWHFLSSNQTQLEKRVKEPEKKLEESNSKTVSPQLTSEAPVVLTLITDPNEVQKYINTLNAWIENYQGWVNVLQSNSSYVSDFNNKYVKQLDETSGSLLFATSLNVRSTNQELLKGLYSRIDELNNGITEIKKNGTVDTKVWSAKKFSDIQAYSDYVQDTVDSVKAKYISDISLITQYLGLISTQIPQFKTTVPQGPAFKQSEINANNNQEVEYAKKKQDCLNMDEEVRTEISVGGGMANETQVQSLVLNRMESMGCFNLPYPYQVPTAICNDRTYTYSLNRSGTCSYHGGVADWYPY